MLTTRLAISAAMAIAILQLIHREGPKEVRGEPIFPLLPLIGAPLIVSVSSIIGLSKRLDHSERMRNYQLKALATQGRAKDEKLKRITDDLAKNVTEIQKKLNVARGQNTSTALNVTESTTAQPPESTTASLSSWFKTIDVSTDIQHTKSHVDADLEGSEVAKEPSNSPRSNATYADELAKGANARQKRAASKLSEFWSKEFINPHKQSLKKPVKSKGGV